jgi:hypothetical protein
VDNGRKATAALTAVVRAGKGAGAKALAAARRMVVDDDALILACDRLLLTGRGQGSPAVQLSRMLDLESQPKARRFRHASLNPPPRIT